MLLLVARPYLLKLHVRAWLYHASLSEGGGLLHPCGMAFFLVFSFKTTHMTGACLVYMLNESL